jgi:hypothetical protein
VSFTDSIARVSQAREDRDRVNIDEGTRVEVRTGYDRSWADGFEVLAASQPDGRALPRTFPVDDVRRAPHDRGW